MSSLRNFDEFVGEAADWPNELSRRKFLQLMGASIALAGVAGCTRNPPEKILPYLRQPEEIIPGKPLFYATALTLGGFARGVLVETHEGRPTKIEGNPLHPASLGSTDVFMQAELLALYDPERSRAVRNSGQISTWEIF
ncbi:MAG: molybdopterin oxidoreductase, partial [Verrucomicrobiota bacterium]|nr:molybdopterin oxidoreductase [Verrucomicrobiota bacterium]